MKKRQRQETPALRRVSCLETGKSGRKIFEGFWKAQPQVLESSGDYLGNMRPQSSLAGPTVSPSPLPAKVQRDGWFPRMLWRTRAMLSSDLCLPEECALGLDTCIRREKWSKSAEHSLWSQNDTDSLVKAESLFSFSMLQDPCWCLLLWAGGAVVLFCPLGYLSRRLTSPPHKT